MKKSKNDTRGSEKYHSLEDLSKTLQLAQLLAKKETAPWNATLESKSEPWSLQHIVDSKPVDMQDFCVPPLVQTISEPVEDLQLDLVRFQ